MIKKITIFFILIFILLASCTQKRVITPQNPSNLHKTVYIDVSFNSLRTSDIIDCLHEWECSTNHMISYNIITNYSVYFSLPPDPQHSLIILQVDGSDPRIVESDEALKKSHPTQGLLTVGLYLRGANIPTILIVSPRIQAEGVSEKAVILHEIGHSLYLEHADVPNSIMYINRRYGSSDITKYDLETFCGTYQCDSEKLNVCH